MQNMVSQVLWKLLFYAARTYKLKSLVDISLKELHQVFPVTIYEKQFIVGH